MAGCKTRQRDVNVAVDNLGPERKPAALRLTLGDVSRAVHTEFCRIVQRLDCDPLLRAAPAAGFVLECLLITSGHLHVRFKHFENYPFAVLRMCQALNPEQYFMEICLFVRKAESELDPSYSALLQHEAWMRGGTELGAVGWLCKPEIQQELHDLATNIAPNSLDVERKHALDKQSERRRAMSVAAASRNSILKRWRIFSRQLRDKAGLTKQARKKERQSRFANIRALAIRRQPELFPQARGRMRWERGVSGEEAKSIKSAAAEHALTEYVHRHREALEAELVSLRRANPERAVASDHVWPATKAAWLPWLEEHEEHFAVLMRACRGGLRRRHNERVEPGAFPLGRCNVRPRQMPSAVSMGSGLSL